ncbi:MAG: hypothetical protein ACPLW9_01475, partial [Minisyncoccales bacterium]
MSSEIPIPQTPKPSKVRPEYLEKKITLTPEEEKKIEERKERQRKLALKTLRKFFTETEVNKEKLEEIVRELEERGVIFVSPFQKESGKEEIPK